MSRNPTELVFAICHEVGNLLAAVRLQAHLLDEERTPKELALASIELDDASARAGALLGLVRPLLEPEADRWVPFSPANMVAAVTATVEGQGLRGVEVATSIDEGLPMVALDPEALQAMLLCQLYSALDAATEARGRVELGVRCDEAELVFAVENDATADDDLDDWPNAALRGRPLACAAAHQVLAGRGGRIVVPGLENEGDGNIRIRRVEFRLPR